MQENLLTGKIRPTPIRILAGQRSPLITDTAKAFWTGLFPAAGAPNVNVVSTGSDPLFDPVDAASRCSSTGWRWRVNGRLGGNPQALASASLPNLLSALGFVRLSRQPGSPPAAPADKPDVTASPITIAPGDSALPVASEG